ncbi:MAG: membrane protein insertase YidC [Gammaproteobacteria bacterium]|nr:membrane protein insertase YidC [Gammaproteobacteria bacterium]
MQQTEVIRYALLAGLLITAYLLILAWNSDYGSASRPADRAAATADPLQDNDVPTGEVPSGATPVPSASESPEIDDTVPEVVAGEVPTATTEDAPTISQMEGLIRVRTDSLNVWIDRRGDLVKLTLPKHPVSLETPDVPLTLLDRTPSFLYVAQSGLAGPDGVDARPEGRPTYHTDSDLFEMQPGQDQLIVPLRFEDPDGFEVEKRFIFTRGDHEVRLEYHLTNPRERPLRAAMYGQIRRSGGQPPDFSPPGMGMRPYVGAAFTTSDSRYEKVSFSDLASGWEARVQRGWVAMLQHYFLSAWIPDSDAEHLYRGRQRPDGTYLIEFIGPVVNVAPGASEVIAASFYAGPKIQSRLAEISENLNLTVDYGFLWWISVPLFKVLDFLHGLVGNWGFAIILLTLLVKLALYPLSAAAYRSMANMRRMAPEMKRLQERYSDDRQKLSKEMMDLYRKEKINPLGGCLPMLAQMPVFLALYWVLYESVELRHAPFILWIHDLSAIDPYFVLPLLMGATMFLQMQLNPAPLDPMQAKIMKLMPIMFTVLFLFFPAGLVLYWLVNNVLSIAQQWWVMRQIEMAAPASKGSK